MSDSDKPLDQNQVITKFKELQSQCKNIATKISEMQEELGEHRLVEQTLQPLDTKRRAFRLVGGVLVERTVGEVLPSVISNRENLEGVVNTMKNNLEQKEKELLDWKNKYNIRLADEQQ